MQSLLLQTLQGGERKYDTKGISANKIAGVLWLDLPSILPLAADSLA